MSRLSAIPNGTDAFVHAIDGFMHRRGQGVHCSQSILVLERKPDCGALRTALAETLQHHPLLTAWLRKRHPVAVPHYETAPDPAREIPFERHENPFPQETGGSAPDTIPLLQKLPAYPTHPGFCNVRCDLAPHADGTWWFVLSWRHQILDAIGAELLLQEIACPGSVEGTASPTGGEMVSFVERWKRTEPINTHFFQVRNPRFRSLGGAKIRPSTPRCHRITLTCAETVEVKRRAAASCGIVHTPFFLAAATRAHARVFASRGTMPPGHVVNIPVQLRKRRARMTPIFQNHLSLAYYAVTTAETATFDGLVAAFQERQAQGLKKRLAGSFHDLLELMRRMPPELYIHFVRLHMRGEFNTFYHSLTGEFAPGLKEFFGARIENAWHAPALYQPPGSGVFANEKNGRLTIVFAWREPGVTRDEIAIMEEGLLADLLGPASAR